MKPVAIAVQCALVLSTLAIALWLFPFDCDGAFVVHDALVYGIQAERTPEAFLHANHLLFHALVWALVEPLRAVGIPHPGHVGCRIVAGLGGAWLLLQLAAAAGRRRILAGAAFALVVAASRGFVVETASGENVLPAAAAALFALTCAARPAARLWSTGAALTFALLLREDNIFIVPGVAIGIATAASPGNRVRSVAKLLISSGFVTIGGYLAGWAIETGGHTSFFAWLPGGRAGPFSGPAHLEWSRFAVYASSIAAALTGRLAPASDPDPFIGLGYVAALLLAGFLMRARSPCLRLAIPIGCTLLGRAFFHTWFEADNFEWLVLPVVLVAAFAARLADGEPATSVVSRRLGFALLLALAVWMVVAHAWSTWKLRERTYIRSVEAATDVDRAKWSFLAASPRAHLALGLLRVPHRTVMFEDPNVLAEVVRSLLAHLEPTVILLDRLADGMPWSVSHVSDRLVAIDTMPMPPEYERLLQGRLVYGLRWTPPESASRPATR